MSQIGATPVDVRVARWLVAALVAFLAVSWWPGFVLPLGDSHEGRVLGQFSLHVANFWELGPWASSFGASWEPFSEVPYTHHPPLLTFLHLLTSTFAGQGLTQVKSISYLAGLATIPALWWLGRRLGLGALPAFGAVAALVATPWWWVYGRLGLGLLPNVIMIGALWAVVEESTPRRLRLAAAASFAAVAASWHGVFLAPLLLLWLWRRRGCDRAVIAAGVGMIAGGLVILIWVAQGGGFGEWGDHLGTRVGGDWGWGEFLSRQWRFARGLLPTWYLVAAVLALVAGLADIRTRFVTGALIAMVVVFSLVPADGAWIHDYWNFPVLLALFPGFAVLIDWTSRWAAHQWKRGFGDRLAGLVRLKVVVLISVVAAALLVMDPIGHHDRYFVDPAQAGELVAAVDPSPDQVAAWYAPQVPWPTWIAHAWELPPAALAGVGELATVPDDDLVVLRLDRLPAWLDPAVIAEAHAVAGRYVVVRGDHLRLYKLGVDR
ncbi:MAG: hypothetical protein VX833_00790 [Actinomycetota bacterium]|nr:hypothetical protein [Actinomycetota bacterium]